MRARKSPPSARSVLVRFPATNTVVESDTRIKTLFRPRLAVLHGSGCKQRRPLCRGVLKDQGRGKQALVETSLQVG